MTEAFCYSDVVKATSALISSFTDPGKETLFTPRAARVMSARLKNARSVTFGYRCGSSGHRFG
ncbi:hypothetical protein KCP76_22115 [Salmonella enterica subsp. enterica serovar Weltevreden]|nr:hypothetical protein KCP76_22115 [Salmonella enterica subsp. enterica serovar Weltevreden]